VENKVYLGLKNKMNLAILSITACVEVRMQVNTRCHDDMRVALWPNRIHKVTTMVLFGEQSTIHVML